MKSTLIIIALIASTLSVVAQSQNIDKRLLAKYSVEELDNIKTSSPKEYKILNHCLDNGWYLSALPTEKMKNNDGRIGSIVIKDIKKINFFELNIELIQDDYQFFAIEGTQQMLVVKSKDHILKDINK